MNYKELEDILNYTFKDESLIEKALTHKSCKKDYNNERLEFLGDAVLDLVVAEYLYFNLKNANEGEMSKIRASLVNENSFAKIAKAINLGKFIRLSQSEERNKGREKSSLLSNTFEAVIGAIYLESGLECVKVIVNKILQDTFPIINLHTLFRDYKTTLQEITQAKFGVIPVYTMVGSSGPDHEKKFEIRVEIDKIPYATAIGKSKKQAQQLAAEQTLEMLKNKTSEGEI